MNDIENSDDLDRLNTDTSKINKDLYSSSTGTSVDASLDTRFFNKDGRKEIKKDYVDMNKNMNTIAKTLPDANSDNKIEEWTGIGWNFVTGLTGGILPSNANNGGLLAQVPVLTGTPDSQQRTAQIVNHLSKAYEDNKNLYIEFEKSDSYKSLSSKDKEKYKNKGLYISKKPITITKETASGQNSVNGILNSMSDAIKGGLHLTGQTDFTKPITLNVIYNPTNGFFSDILEAGVDKFGGTTGTAKQVGKALLDTKEARKGIDTNFALHSQGNALAYSGIKYIQDQEKQENKLKDNKIVGSNTNKKDNNNVGSNTNKKDNNTVESDTKKKPINEFLTISSYGSLMNEKTMNKVIGKDGLGLKDIKISTNGGDFVAETLGLNKKNTDKFGHKAEKYDCIENCGYLK